MIVDKIINVNIHTTIPISPTFLSQIVKVILNYYWYLAGYINWAGDPEFICSPWLWWYIDNGHGRLDHLECVCNVGGS